MSNDSLFEFTHLVALLEILTYLIVFFIIKTYKLSYHETFLWVLDHLAGYELSNDITFFYYFIFFTLFFSMQ